MAHIEANRAAQHDVHVGVRGRLVLPAQVRRRLGVREGDRMILTIEPDGSLRLVGLREQVKRLKGIYRRVAPGVSLADELIRQRRREARREGRR